MYDLIYICFLLWRKKYSYLGKVLGFMVVFVSFMLWWCFGVFSYNLSHAIFLTAVFQISSLWRLLMLNIITFQTLFKLCLLIYIFGGHSTNKTESICVTLHLRSLTSSIVHKYKTLWIAWKQFLQSACILLSEVYFHEVDDTQVTNEDLDTHTCNQVVFYVW